MTMKNKLYYVCDNTEKPNESPNDIFQLDMHLFEDVTFQASLPEHELHSLWDLMSSFSFRGERSYHSIDRKTIEKHLVKVVNVEIEIQDRGLSIRYDFENGKSFFPEREEFFSEEVTKETIEKLVFMVKEAAPHIFYVNIPLLESDFTFEGEQWG